jgi:hypothetical protein
MNRSWKSTVMVGVGAAVEADPRRLADEDLIEAA